MAVESPRIGLHYRATDLSMPLIEFVRASESLGFESLYFAEHTHVPVVRSTPMPGSDVEEAARGAIAEPPTLSASAPGFRRYQRIWDPYISMAWLAPQTSMRLGTCISLIGEHDAIALAKAIATLDQLTEGRLVIGVGQGWVREEFEDHGAPFDARGQVLRESVQLMKELWTKQVAAYQGEYVRLTPSYAWPKPYQVPHPPLLLGCRASERGFEEIVDWADGWIPQALHPSETFGHDIARLRERWHEKGRLGEPRVVVMHEAEDEDEFRSAMSLYRREGVEEVLFDVPTDSADVLVPLLHRLALYRESA